VKEIAIKLNISENNCRNKMSILKKKQLVVKVGNGYGLVEKRFEDGSIEN
jgi:predicted transcriptional regulator